MESFGFLLNDTSRLMRRRFDGYARALGVTRAQWQTLLGISRNEGINQAGLADRLEIENITLCRMVDRLEESGLVERRADPKDRRVWRLHLTAKSMPVIAQLHDIASRLQSEMAAGLSAEEQALLEDLLMRVRMNITSRAVETAQA